MPSASQRLSALLAALIMCLSACSPPTLGSNLTYAEAREQLKQLVDGGLDAGLNHREHSLASLEESDSCDRSGIFPTQGVTPVYAYHFAYESLEPDVDALINGVTSYWESAGLRLDPQGPRPDTRNVFATSKEGYSLEVFVNRTTGMALIEGSGPCFSDAEG